MKTILLLMALASVTASATTAAAGSVAAPKERSSRLPETNASLDSGQMEKELQRLPWKQFRAVVESEPKLKAGIDAYGPIGWQFVQANYSTYGWKKNIDKLDARQKKHLAAQIQRARGVR